MTKFCRERTEQGTTKADIVMKRERERRRGRDREREQRQYYSRQHHYRPSTVATIKSNEIA